MNIGEELKYNREIRHYSQNEVAKHTGISQPQISYYESGTHIPPMDLCIKLADFYDISLDELVGRGEFERKK